MGIQDCGETENAPPTSPLRDRDPLSTLLLCSEIHSHIHPQRPCLLWAENYLVLLNSHKEADFLITSPILHLKTLNLKDYVISPKAQASPGPALLPDLLCMYHGWMASLTQRA